MQSMSATGHEKIICKQLLKGNARVFFAGLVVMLPTMTLVAIIQCPWPIRTISTDPDLQKTHWQQEISTML
jgi:hypothetical protein